MVPGMLNCGCIEGNRLTKIKINKVNQSLFLSVTHATEEGIFAVRRKTKEFGLEKILKKSVDYVRGKSQKATHHQQGLSDEFILFDAAGISA